MRTTPIVFVALSLVLLSGCTPKSEPPPSPADERQAKASPARGIKLAVYESTFRLDISGHRFDGQPLVLRCRFDPPADGLNTESLPMYWRERYGDWGLDALVDGQWTTTRPEHYLDRLVRDCEIHADDQTRIGRVQLR